MITVLKIPSSSLTVDETTEGRVVPEHLVVLMQRDGPKGYGVGVKLSDMGKATVVRGRTYARLAQSLGWPSLICIVEGGAEHAEEFVSRWGGQRLDFRKLLEESDNEAPGYGWHVYFFDRQLTDSSVEAFAQTVLQFFDRFSVLSAPEPPVRHVEVDRQRQFIAFEAFAPYKDQGWFNDHLRACVQFTQGETKIVSYQGTRWRF